MLQTIGKKNQPPGMNPPNIILNDKRNIKNNSSMRENLIFAAHFLNLHKIKVFIWNLKSH